uniref:RING-type E3 ubiquitin transferase n=1 Tax=Mastacembelus armatus TaxID=205130 RepID=A0A3Q3KWL6_9TELE
MAEAAETPQDRFFCHCCKCETNPKLPNFICSRCDSGFTEEMIEDSRYMWKHTSGLFDRSLLWSLSKLLQLVFMERSALLSQPPSSQSDPNDSEQVSAGQSYPSLVSVERLSGHEQRPAVEGIAQQFLAGLFANNGNPDAALSNMPQFYSNPVDYVFVQGNLDALATEVRNTGPPPAEKVMISSLPTVCISREQTDCRLDCPVCMEDYSLGETVRKLPCLHYFHSECIVPWLELHDTCPVCRKSLDGVDNNLPPISEPPDTYSVRTEQQERQAI